ncbi:outer membrane receptor protein involved in Fe transport [Povalibacter uvarum]|uniref:Outer membrane receptor protein involved in Fe transport n=1 Tax=Povalibacter uvarum TaxID=732238 RepID=A0A841HLA3_9GAMM|nr:TonB-dependent receptor [Povalibacter uvarum]MBB6093523.1 outer membrane receptor protein involved in Fe transport [Povalibacter uvarum]
MINLHYGRRARGTSSAALAMTIAAILNASAAGAQEAKPGTLEEVIVTGTLISDPNHVAPSPIVIASAEELRQTGAVTLEASLNQLPQFSPAGTAGNGGQGTGGHATVNLRGLGSNRNLVLLDGRRLPLADISGNVDINLIPDSVLASVQTITGGASAVYGSDAMSGVVNFITLGHFEGITADVQYGNSERGDYEQVTASSAFGTSFADGKGNALIAAGYSTREGLSGAKREFFEFVTPSSFIGQGTFVPSATNLPNQAAVNTLFASYGAVTPVSNTLNLGFNDNGTLFTQTGAKNYQGPTTDGYAIIAGNVRMPVGPQTMIMNPLDRTSVFSKFDYEFSPDLTLYGQFMYVDSEVHTSSGGSLTQFGTLTTIPITNPFIPNDLRTLLASRPNPNAPFTWNGRYVGIPAKAWDESYTTAQYLAGLKGSLPWKNWTWDVYGAYDTTDHVQSNYHAVLKSRVQALLNAPDGGNSICAGGFNPFSLANSRNISDACEAYMTTTATSTEALSQTNFQGVVQGSLFSLPAGDMKLALLGSYRENTYRSNPDSQLAAQNIEAVIASQASIGEYDVTEFAGQIDIPVLSGLPLIEQLNIGAAFRRSDYSTSGSVDSYEGDIKWTPVPGLLIRGGYQRAVRAPNIGELFAADTGGQIAFGTPPAAIGDPCDIRSTARTGAGGSDVRSLCLAQGIPASVIDTYTFPTTATASLTHGNPALAPETANTYNIGFSWNSRAESPWLSNMSVSLDYYSIDIEDVISVVPGLTALSKCYNLDGSNPSYAVNNPFCTLLTRDSNGLLQLIETPYLNLGGLRTSGVDLQLSWSADVGPGNLYFSTGVGYSEEFAVQTLPGTQFQDYGGTNTIGSSHPELKALTTLGYGFGGATVAVRWRFQDAMADVTSVTTPTNPGVGVPTYNLYDLVATYELNDQWQFRAGVTNLTDEESVFVSSSQTSTDTSVFDPVGRSYYFGVKFSM